MVRLLLMLESFGEDVSPPLAATVAVEHDHPSRGFFTRTTSIFAQTLTRNAQ
jgi:hypothetical protein